MHPTAELFTAKAWASVVAARLSRSALPDIVDLGKGLNAVLGQVNELISSFSDSHIAIEHFLLALAMDDRCGKQLRSQPNAFTHDQKDVMQGIRGVQTATDQNLNCTYESPEKGCCDLSKAAELEYGTVAELHKKLAANEDELNASGSDKIRLREEVTEADSAEVIPKRTGPPVAKLVKSEMEKLAEAVRRRHDAVINAVALDWPAGMGSDPVHQFGRSGAPSNGDWTPRLLRASRRANSLACTRLPSRWRRSPHGKGERKLRVSQSGPAKLSVLV